MTARAAVKAGGQTFDLTYIVKETPPMKRSHLSWAREKEQVRQRRESKNTLALETEQCRRRTKENYSVPRKGVI